MTRRTLVCLSICFIAFGCGPKEERPPDITPGNNPNTNNGTNNGTTNNGTLPLNNGFGEACRGVECPDGLRCVAGVCVDDALLVSC